LALYRPEIDSARQIPPSHVRVDEFDQLTRSQEYQSADNLSRYSLGLEALGINDQYDISVMDAIRIQHMLTNTQSNGVDYDIDLISQSPNLWISARSRLGPTAGIPQRAIGMFSHELHAVIGIPNATADLTNGFARFTDSLVADINNPAEFIRGSLIRHRQFLADPRVIKFEQVDALISGDIPPQAFTQAANDAGLLFYQHDRLAWSEAISLTQSSSTSEQSQARELFREIFDHPEYSDTTGRQLLEDWAWGLTFMHLTGGDTVRQQAIENLSSRGSFTRQDLVDTAQQLVDWSSTRMPTPSEVDHYYTQLVERLTSDSATVELFDQAADHWNAVLRYFRGDISQQEALSTLQTE